MVQKFKIIFLCVALNAVLSGCTSLNYAPGKAYMNKGSGLYATPNIKVNE